VTLVPERVSELTEKGVITKSGKSFEFDVIIWATGFQTFNYHIPIEVVGRDGVKLREQWGDSPCAYLATFYHNFPNMFTLYGPNLNTNHGSALFMLECQIEMILRMMKRVGLGDRLEPSQKVVEGYNIKIQQRCSKKVWGVSGVNWYTNKKGHVISNWPDTCMKFWYTSATAKIEDLLVSEK